MKDDEVGGHILRLTERRCAYQMLLERVDGRGPGQNKSILLKCILNK
jgi:hypothetical protein